MDPRPSPNAMELHTLSGLALRAMRYSGSAKVPHAIGFAILGLYEAGEEGLDLGAIGGSIMVTASIAEEAGPGRWRLTSSAREALEKPVPAIVAKAIAFNRGVN